MAQEFRCIRQELVFHSMEAVLTLTMAIHEIVVQVSRKSSPTISKSFQYESPDAA